MKFNKQLTKPNRTVNMAGGEAFTQSEKLELVSILLCSFLEPQFYRSADQTAKRLQILVRQIGDKSFIAKAALYARREAGMRSVSHLVAGELAQHVKGAEWSKRFFDKIAVRVDDVTEILAYTLAVHGKPLPNAMKKGLGAALSRFDAYQLAKYRGRNGAVKLVDAVNLLHPPHTEALRQLIRGTLAPANTWETRISQAGQAGDKDQVAEAKTEAWTDLLRSRKIGYFALLRNLRNILDQAPGLTNDAIALLTDPSLIRKSRILPFRYRSAMEAVEQAGLQGGGRVLEALSAAADLSLANVPAFSGRTLIAVDDSGSMQSGRPPYNTISCLFASVLYKKNDADLMLFSTYARYKSLNRNDSTLSLAAQLERHADGGGTNFHAIFQTARPKARYDRVVILSDMQGWMGYNTPTSAFEKYVRKAEKRPTVYSFDLAGYGTLQFPEQGVYCLAGFSDKSLETMRFLEDDKSALVRTIEAVEL